jgi:hypothetical protein
MPGECGIKGSSGLFALAAENAAGAGVDVGVTACGSIMARMTALDTLAAFKLLRPSKEVSKFVRDAAWILAMTMSSGSPAAARAMTSALLISFGFAELAAAEGAGLLLAT